MIAAVDALDRLHEVQTCYTVLEALLLCHNDLNLVNGGDLATLLSVLNRHQDEALQALTQAAKAT
ncbi:MAG: hypothetical protein PHH59_14410 [Methylovulum sp.]|uniref:hypothetical protein n=1 Tax=Methylovulum sp. TaxID=1916980 RepID=UPI0026018B02|nr:hypothetical protein [Methylovulum sp.]MDD2725198.1 hypothetical protein [Methylovulum sp.]MDD5125443.1 hypothetical protein [Methylovulum sp.]